MRATATPDTIVIGAGLVGLAVAYELAIRGQRVLMLEQESIGAGALAAAGGFVSVASRSSGPVRSLVRESQSRLRVLGERLGADIGLRSCGSLFLAADEAEAGWLRQHAEELSDAQVAAELVQPEHLAELDPIIRGDLAGGLRCDGDLQIDPQRLVKAYADALRREGGELREDRVVVGVRTRNGRAIGVTTRFGDHDADAVVVTAGCWTPVLLPESHASLIHARRGQVLMSQARRRCVQHLLVGADYVSRRDDADGLGFTLEQTVDGALRLGSTRERAGYDCRPTSALVRAQVNAARYVRLPEDVVWSSAMAGLRPTTADGLPLIGQVRRGLWVASGHAGYGCAAAAATGARLAAAICGQGSDLRAFNPRRFMSPEYQP